MEGQQLQRRAHAGGHRGLPAGEAAADVWDGCVQRRRGAYHESQALSRRDRFRPAGAQPENNEKRRAPLHGPATAGRLRRRLPEGESPARRQILLQQPQRGERKGPSNVFPEIHAQGGTVAARASQTHAEGGKERQLRAMSRGGGDAGDGAVSLHSPRDRGRRGQAHPQCNKATGGQPKGAGYMHLSERAERKGQIAAAAESGYSIQGAAENGNAVRRGIQRKVFLQLLSEVAD